MDQLSITDFIQPDHSEEPTSTLHLPQDPILLSKMETEHATPIQYQLKTSEMTIPMNLLIGHEIVIDFHHEIYCTECGNQTAKSFFQGFCYPCFQDSPYASECILRPECCRAHEGIGRDMEWEKEHHLQPHIVYLAASSAIKVGVTRDLQMPTRWIDQGASKAIILAEPPNRYLAGCIEVALKAYMTDKTSWQKMLKNITTQEDLIEKKHQIKLLVPEEYVTYLSDNDTVFEFGYPVLQYPEKVKSLNLDKQDRVEGKLLGIKGQYLIFDENRVFNIRKHTGYRVTLSKKD